MRKTISMLTINMNDMPRKNDSIIQDRGTRHQGPLPTPLAPSASQNPEPVPGTNSEDVANFPLQGGERVVGGHYRATRISEDRIHPFGDERLDENLRSPPIDLIDDQVPGQADFVGAGYRLEKKLDRDV